MVGDGRHLQNGVGGPAGSKIGREAVYRSNPAGGPDAKTAWGDRPVGPTLKNDAKNNASQIRASAVPGRRDPDSSSGVHAVTWLQRAG